MFKMIPNFGAFLVRSPHHSAFDSPLSISSDHARLKEHISSMPGGLEATINEGGKRSDSILVISILSLAAWSDTLGSNLSVGQRQLVSLARALLTPTNILGMCLFVRRNGTC